MIAQVFIHIKRVEVFGVKAGKEHIHHDGNIDLLVLWKIGIYVFLVFDALLQEGIVLIKVLKAAVFAVLRIVVGDDFCQRRLAQFGLLFIVLYLLREILL